MTNRLLRFVVVQVALCLLLLWIWPRPEIDDAYIFFTYARHLATSGLFEFNPGEVSYGFSSPAYVLLLAGASRISGIPVGVALSNLVGILMCALASIEVWLLWDETGDELSAKEGIFAAVLLSGPWFYTVWFVFGMETGLAVLGLLGFLLWLVKARGEIFDLRWLCLGIGSTSVLAITRLESGIYIACGLLLALIHPGTKRFIRDVVVVGMISGCVEVGWLIYAKHTFGTYMPWTGTARLLYYLPEVFPVASAEQFYHLGAIARSLLALHAAEGMFFGSLLRFLLLSLPLVVAVLLLLGKNTRPNLKWFLGLITFATVFQIIAFSYLFPLAKNRHLAPYVAGLWVLVVPSIVRFFGRMGRPVQMTFAALTTAVWIAGAVHYRFEGRKLEPLHQMAIGGHLLPTDRVAAEPIGILSFESQAHIIDLGGLTDRDVWPLLMQRKQASLSSVIAWETGKGASKLVIKANECDGRGKIFGIYCLIDVSAAQSLLGENKMRVPDKK